ncbi:hypothetical protein [Rosistilla ulvae]|uniref:Uncharacterized protein n=1 Tax=Rosistilla ulvae TaxID=1930277 RepID=A0A517LTR7_9BACT|nr:hypothetical protein [Rosistilla ulvae]QDS85989.1 hypothetical protein EC9_01470 [Rosistilla ulvae]
MDAMQLLQWVNNPSVIVGLFSTAVILVAIDFHFPIDWPAHLGYVAFALGLFLVIPLNLVASTFVGVLGWLLLEIMHALLFGRFLTNAPGRARSRPAVDDSSEPLDLDA